MLTNQNFHKWKLWVKIAISNIFTYCTEYYTRSPNYLRHLRLKGALMSLETLPDHICPYTYSTTYATRPKLRFHKFESENIVKICGFFNRLYMVYGGHLTCKVHLNTSNFTSVVIKSHIRKILSRSQQLNFTKNRIFRILKLILQSWFRQHMLTGCCLKLHCWKLWGLSFQTHHLPSLWVYSSEFTIP